MLRDLMERWLYAAAADGYFECEAEVSAIANRVELRRWQVTGQRHPRHRGAQGEGQAVGEFFNRFNRSPGGEPRVHTAYFQVNDNAMWRLATAIDIRQLGSTPQRDEIDRLRREVEELEQRLRIIRGSRTQSQSQSVNHLRVSNIINATLAIVNEDHTITRPTNAVERAWESVNSRRLRGDCSVDLAAAEHYLFCRFLISRHSPAFTPFLRTFSTLYDAAKLVGIEYREASCPQSPVSWDDMLWREQGMFDGGEDFMGNTHVGMLGAPPSPSLPPPASRNSSPAHQPGTHLSGNTG